MKHTWFIGRFMDGRGNHFLLPLVLGIVLGVGGYWLSTGGPKNYRIRQQFHDQMMAHLPATTEFDGKPHRPQDIKIVNMTEGSNGYEVEIRIVWSDTDMVTATTAILEADGFGHYRCQWDSGSFGQFTFDLAG